MVWSKLKTLIESLTNPGPKAGPVDESVEQFRGCCLEAFAYLREEYGFSEVKPPRKDPDPYLVKFSNGEIALAVRGLSYGTAASVYYLTRDGLEAPTLFLEPGWSVASLGKKQKREKGPEPTQRQQIFNAARRIRERDADILGGDYTRLEDVALRWKEASEKLYGGV